MKVMITTYGSEEGFLTRNEIIEMWNAQDEEKKNSLCCPHCRNIMVEHTGGAYRCTNNMCMNVMEYREKEDKHAV